VLSPDSEAGAAVADSKTRDAEIGAWLNLASPYIAEASSRLGFDFVVLDMQHGLIDEAGALAMLQATDLGGARPAVRCAHSGAAHVGRMLDFGALDLIVPMIESAAEAHELVRACLYAPEGNRSFGPTRAGLRHKSYFEDGPSEIRLFPMVETSAALDDVDSIAALHGVAGLFVGPADLSLSLGLRPARDQEAAEFSSAIDRILAACRRHGKIAGIQADRSVMAKRLRQGFSFLTVCMDSSDLRESFKKTLAEARGVKA